jgi:hypothetical protein
MAVLDKVHVRDELGREHVLARITRNEVHPRQERAVDCTQRSKFSEYFTRRSQSFCSATHIVQAVRRSRQKSTLISTRFARQRARLQVRNNAPGASASLAKARRPKSCTTQAGCSSRYWN